MALNALNGNLIIFSKISLILLIFGCSNVSEPPTMIMFNEMKQKGNIDSTLIIGQELILNDSLSFNEFMVVHSYLRENTLKDYSELSSFGFEVARNKEDSLNIFCALMGDHFTDGRYDSAEDCAINILAIDPELNSNGLYTFEAYFMLGLTSEKKSDAIRALEHYLKAIHYARMSQDSCFSLKGVYSNLKILGERTNNYGIVEDCTKLLKGCE